MEFTELPERHKKKPQNYLRLRAEDEARTRDNQLGRLELYQLSYFRLNADANINNSFAVVQTFFEKNPINAAMHLFFPI